MNPKFGGKWEVAGGRDVPMAAEPTVFVVEDDAGVRDSLRALASSAGLAVETYASGREFLAAYDSGRTGCLLLDFRLRDSDSLEVQQELKRRHATLPVIVLTGDGSSQASVQAFEGGAVEVLQKPVPAHTLLDRVRSAIATDAQRRAAAIEANVVASLWHELRTALQAVAGYHELLLEGTYGPLTSEQAEIVTRVKRNTDAMLALVKEALELSRLQAHALPLQPREIRIDAFIEQVAAEVRVLHRHPAVGVDWHVPPDLPPLRTDPVKLKIVLTNLVTNAIKFTERGRVTVAVQRDAGGMEFSVSDTGCGIAPEVRDLIFEPFGRAEHAWTRCVDGAGLGLYLVRRIVDGFGGRVAVDSEVGRGSCFRVWIPSLNELRIADTIARDVAAG